MRSLKFGLSFCTVFLLACRAGFVLQKAQSYTNRQPPFLTRPNSLSVSMPKKLLLKLLFKGGKNEGCSRKEKQKRREERRHG